MEESISLYVSTTGSDSWSGTLAEPNKDGTDGPFATLRRARDAAREARGERPVSIVLREGKYFLGDTLRLRPEDNGLTITAYNGEKPVISGGRRITGWKPYKGNIMQCDIPEARGGKWFFRQLYLNGMPQVRARYPKYDPNNPRHGGYARIEGPTDGGTLEEVAYKEGTFPRRWAKPSQGEMNLWLQGSAIRCLVSIKSIDEAKRIIHLDRQPQDWNLSPWFYGSCPAPDDRFYVENILEELDQPGEWCLDTTDGKLYFWPPDGVDLEKDEVVAPYVKTLVEIKGSKSGFDAWKPASGISISGLTFTETQGGEAMHHAETAGIGGQISMRGDSYCGEAILLWGAEKCTVEECDLHNLGGNGIYLLHFNKRNRIRHNKIRDGAFCGVCMVGGKNLNPLPVWPEHPIFNEITDNHIHNVALQDVWSAGIYLGLSESNDVSHNLIHDLPHHAICFGSSGYGRNYIEYNRIHHVCLETSDNGAINGWMEDYIQTERSGHFIRFNFISDVGNPSSPITSAIYLDNETSNCFVYGNILARVHAGVCCKGKNNVIENNIFRDITGRAPHHGIGIWMYESFYYPFGNKFMMSHRIERNIFHRVDAFISFHGYDVGERATAKCDNNVYFNDGDDLLFWPNVHLGDREPMSEWKTLSGFDAHSVAEAPMFVDAVNDNYTLMPESPALKIGFQSIDMSKIGIRQST